MTLSGCFSVGRGVEGQLLGGVSLNLHSLRVSDVEVLWRPLLGRWAMLGVGAALLRRGVVQHDGGRAVAGGVVRSRHTSWYMSLCELADGGEAVGQLVGLEAVALHGEGGLGGAVARRQVRRRRSRKTSRVEQRLRLRASLRRLSVSRAGGRVLGGRLVPGGGAGGLGVMDGALVVGEGLSSVHGLLPRWTLSLTRVLRSRRTHRLRRSSRRQHPRSALQHRVNRLSVVVRRHGLDHLTVLQVGLGVRRRHQRRSCCRGCS